jgi:hypothetical protein
MLLTALTCHLSPDGYPSIVCEQLKLAEKDRFNVACATPLACSGAPLFPRSPTPNVFQPTNLQAQIERLQVEVSAAPADQVNVISLTAGVDELDWLGELSNGAPHLRSLDQFSPVLPDGSFQAWAGGTSYRVQSGLQRDLAKLLAPPMRTS